MMFISSILSGVLIGIGDIIMMEVDNPYIAALCFSVALLCVIELQCPLYTGMIGKVGEKYNLWDLLVALCGNVIGCCWSLFNYMCMYDDAHIIAKMADKRFANVDYYRLYFAGFMCGVLIHVAVTAKKTAITILAIMVFILCGFRHSIADAGYAFMSLNPAYLRLWVGVLLGNSAGGIIANALLPTSIKYGLE